MTGGVDTHADSHVAAVIDPLGRHLAYATFPTTPAVYRALIGRLKSHGDVGQVGAEGTGAYGAGLARTGAIRPGWVAVAGARRSSIRRSAGHASMSASGGMRRAA